jgi:transcription elongation factor GreB
MSRGFVKEEDQEEAPFIPPRAALPAGVVNYVTPAGMEKLLAEKQMLEQERQRNQQENELERRRANMVVDGKMQLLEERIASARILKPEDQPQNEVRFGALVHLKAQDGKNDLQFRIVGVDEASVKNQLIAFTAPVARAVTGKKAGEEVNLKLGDNARHFVLKSIKYEKL